MSRTNRLLIAAGAAVVAVYLAQDAPDAVDIDAAADTEATDEGDLSGTWTVDPSIGTFNVTESTGTFVGFRVDEELTGPGEVEAIGRTPAVTGSLTLEETVVTEASRSRWKPPANSPSTA